MNLVQACLCAGKTLQRSFDRRGCAMKHVQACLSARKDRDISFHHCRDPVKVVQSCLSAGNTLEQARAGLFKNQ